MTHDESSSIIGLIGHNNLAILFDSDEWRTANNHWLNTFSFQFFHKLFGYNVLALRMGSVLMFPLFVFAIYDIFKVLKVSNFVQVLGFSLLITNPVLFDYFSLARGYAMSIAFLMVALTFLVRYIKLQSSRNLVGYLIFIFLSILSLFSNIIFFFVFSIAAIVVLYKENKITTQLLVGLAIALAGIVVFTFVPLRALSSANEFLWGAPSLKESFISYFSIFAHHQKYMADPNVPLYAFGLVVFLGVLFSGFQFIKKRNSFKENCFFFISISFVVFILSMVLSKYIMGSAYPIDRKCIVYIPFIGLIITLFADFLRPLWLKNILSIVIALLLMIHFYKSINVKSTWEWWYDTYTNEIFQEIPTGNAESPYVGTHWMFFPTLSFYNEKMFDQPIKLGAYSKEYILDQPYDYYVIFKGDFDLFKNDYYIVSEKSNSQTLIKRK